MNSTELHVDHPGAASFVCGVFGNLDPENDIQHGSENLTSTFFTRIDALTDSPEQRNITFLKGQLCFGLKMQQNALGFAFRGWPIHSLPLTPLVENATI